MGKRFKKFVRVTKGFFVIRFLVALVVSVLYIFVAAAIQFAFVKFFGENTFNYIVGGMLSLFLGVVVCRGIGAILFMFAKGWHVAALAYCDRIEKSGASALDVGVRAFFKNLVSFGAVYGVRMLLKNVLADFKTKLWQISEDIPYANSLKRFANHPVVEYLAGDILHYSFDAAIFYIVGHPPEQLNEVPETVLTAVKKYLYSIPSILMSSVQTYILFRFLPKVAKYVLIFGVFCTQGFTAGVLLTVLMYPVFYVLDNALFDPLTMMVFIAAYSKKCDKEFDPADPVVVAVDNILEGGGDDSNEEEEEYDAPPQPPKRERSTQTGGGTQTTTADDFVDIEDSDAPEPPPAEPRAPTVRSSSVSMDELMGRLDSLASLAQSSSSGPKVRESADDISHLPIADADDTTVPVSEATVPPTERPPLSSGASDLLNRVMRDAENRMGGRGSGAVRPQTEAPKDAVSRIGLLRGQSAEGLEDDVLSEFGADSTDDVDI